MVAYSFKPQFIEPILSGKKAQTIRAPRWGERGHAGSGAGLQLYAGMRTKACELILKTVCLYTEPVVLRWRPIVEVKVNGMPMPAGELDAFARRDGFEDFDAMEAFWVETHKRSPWFYGYVIGWRAPDRPVEMGATVAMPASAKAKEAA